MACVVSPADVIGRLAVLVNPSLFGGTGDRDPVLVVDQIEGIAGEPELTLKQHQRRVKDSVAQLKNCGYFD